MIDTLNSALLELQSALTARALYPPSHPVIRTGESRAYELLSHVLGSQPEATVFAIGERVVTDSRILPASQSLAHTLFAALGGRGVDRIVFCRGLKYAELRALLDALAADEHAPLPSSPCLRLGYMQELDHAPAAPAAVAEPGAALLPGQLSSALREVWHEIQDGHLLKADLVGDIVTGISRALSQSASAMLPLASLKQHDEYTFVHTINVAMLSTALAEAVGFRGRQLHELALAALLHDIGKERIPLDLLNKSGKFTDEEFRIVQEHPVDGARLLLATPGVPEIAPIVAYEHHVRADGGGYPRLPRGWRLSLASRVVQVADVFDALRTNRPYRPALSLGKIVETMSADAGAFFDRDLLDVFFARVTGLALPAPA